MRLEHDVNMPVAAFARGGQGGANLGGMVAVVVDDGHAARLAAKLKAAVHAPEMADALGDLGRVDLQLMRDGYGGGCVEHVVAARHVQFKGTEQPRWPSRPETANRLPPRREGAAADNWRRERFRR